MILALSAVAIARGHTDHYTLICGIICSHGYGRIGLSQVYASQAEAQDIGTIVDRPLYSSDDIRYPAVAILVDHLDIDQACTWSDPFVSPVGSGTRAGYDPGDHCAVSQEIVCSDLIGQEVFLSNHLADQIRMVLVDARIDHRNIYPSPVDPLIPDPVRFYYLGRRDVMVIV